MEAMVAITVLAIVATAIAGLLVNSIRTARGNTNRVLASNLAMKYIESARSQSALAIPNGMQVFTETVDGIPFTIQQTAQFAVEGSTASLCRAASGSIRYKTVTVEVSYPQLQGDPVRSDTLIALTPKETLDTTRGILAIEVLDAYGAPQPGAKITLTPGSVSQLPGIDGCAVFTGVNVGSYTATASVTGYVSGRNDATAAVSLTAVAGSVQRAGLVYAPSTSLDYRIDNPSGYQIPAGLQIGLRSSGLGGPTLPPACSGSSTSGCVDTAITDFRNVLPSVYDAWLEPCPTAMGTWQSGSAEAGKPGQVAAIPLRGIDLTVTGPSTYTARAVATCAAGETPIALNAVGSNRFQTALPAGTWRIEVLRSGSVVANQTVNTSAASMTLPVTIAAP